MNAVLLPLLSFPETLHSWVLKATASGPAWS
ncbi:hypothetical protein HNR21_003135 [Actinomadura cellulosilytica]|uniref:Uncharacterized protein n=1 Tax=Thermomonospora cellulosilytica TaxID=1411118 RepID=A0A7W3MYL1_9ACTN|nr:hypothetical protein [Thermomonospora cellulosilytica]